MSGQRARELITATYAQYANDANAIQQLQGDAALPLVDLADKLAGLTGKSNQIYGADDKAKSATTEWLKKLDGSDEAQLASSEGLKSLNEQLDNVTYLASNEPTVADLALFASIYPTVSKQQPAEQHATPSVARYVSHLSNLAAVSKAASAAQLGFSPFQPTYEGMPTIERAKPEDLKKAKKANKEAAAAQAQKSEAPQQQTEEQPAKKEKKEKKEKAPKEAKAGGGGGGGKKGGAAAAAADTTGPLPSQVDLRVGKIVSIERHPDADALYLEKVDFGEADGPRTILSGLVNFVPIEKMQNRMVIGVCNLKPASMRGIKSYGMLLCATAKEGKDGGVEPVHPPEGSQVGDKVWVEGFEGREPEAVLNPKKKIFETIQPAYTTTENKECAWVGALPDAADPEADKKPRLLRTEKGVLFSENFVGASLS
ncbi:tRNA-binding domain protein [Kalmanozyma brasiliensis GHG001]|uniref:tRNA-binding protein n=1 Tax=Kalmanozyma brasiliensis (strain GHG001) TaxID=1365824 RepID=V5E4Q8_KALBG|nr:tRNA-binding domain protein [Kalmanozyma brasiliensis GHG001]EST05186.1 tRNA-binding domain protein [Kalmanozyma brasiliensis GHG001]